LDVLFEVKYPLKDHYADPAGYFWFFIKRLLGKIGDETEEKIQNYLA